MLAMIGCLGLIEKLVTLVWQKRVWAILLAVFMIATIGQVGISLLKEHNAAADLAAIRDYSWIARLDVLGNPPGAGIGSDLQYNDELTGLLKDMYTIIDNQIRMKRGIEAEKRYLNVIESFPKFPFGYYFLAISLKERNMDEWRTHAREAQRILKITTQIDGHRPQHDEVLEKITSWLQDD